MWSIRIEKKIQLPGFNFGPQTAKTNFFSQKANFSSHTFFSQQRTNRAQNDEKPLKKHPNKLIFATKLISFISSFRFQKQESNLNNFSKTKQKLV
jgi:hypothetical protein